MLDWIGGSLPLEVLIDVEALYKIARNSALEADNDFRALERGSEAYIR